MTSDGGNGSGRSSGGSGGRSRGRSSSFIAGRRPSARKAAAESDQPTKKNDASADGAKDESREDARPKRRRRRSTATKPAETQAASTRAADAGTDEEPEAAESEAPEAPAATAPAPAPAPPRRSPARSNGAVADGDVRVLLEEQRDMILELKRGFSDLERRITEAGPRPRLGIFVDVPNLLYGQDADEKPINAGKLLAMLSRNREVVRATAYSPVSDDPSEPMEQQKFVAPFVPYEYRIVTKPLKRFADGSIKGNFDVEMAIDMITMADRLDIIAIVSGDADFARAVETVQARGVRVEVVAFARSTSLEMRALADHFVELGALVDQLR